MATIKVKIPKMGMTTEEVDVVSWHVAVGDKVSPAQPLADIESEKTTITIESEVSGTVTAILVALGEISAVGAPICTIELS
ncbi:MAG: branched-chain alpha-keto acid dehydrogenase subunit [Microvirga sp.]|jgi:2-oxoisovalerate dehydrogenase E2 component (dihydrolipoyl transacylase)|nr:branched-chain alpha-keto acid dehydrogenase subunit [Microvirga sp.]